MKVLIAVLLVLSLGCASRTLEEAKNSERYMSGKTAQEFSIHPDGNPEVAATVGAIRWAFNPKFYSGKTVLEGKCLKRNLPNDPGVPCRNITLSIHPVERDVEIKSIQPDASGSFKFIGLKSGLYRIRANAQNSKKWLGKFQTGQEANLIFGGLAHAKLAYKRGQNRVYLFGIALVSVIPLALLWVRPWRLALDREFGRIAPPLVGQFGSRHQFPTLTSG